MNVLTQEIKNKIKTIARLRLKDGQDVVISQSEVNEYSKMLEELYISGEFDIQGEGE